jgi:hypothetical protein
MLPIWRTVDGRRRLAAFFVGNAALRGLGCAIPGWNGWLHDPIHALGIGVSLGGLWVLWGILPARSPQRSR